MYKSNIGRISEVVVLELEVEVEVGVSFLSILESSYLLFVFKRVSSLCLVRLPWSVSHP